MSPPKKGTGPIAQTTEPAANNMIGTMVVDEVAAINPPAQELARPLKVLVPLIDNELLSAAVAGLEHYSRAGAMLIEAKSQMKHGEWSGWVKRNFKLSQRHAARYMTLAKENGHACLFSSLREATAPKRTNVSTRQTINVEAIAAQWDAEERAQQQRHGIAKRLITAGYHELAKVMHPDRGGRAEQMAELTQVRADLLKTLGPAPRSGRRTR